MTSPYPQNKWAAIAATRLADAASVHLSINGQPTTPQHVAALSRILATAVERVVTSVITGPFLWSSDAASRAEALVESTIRGHGAPFGGDVPEWRAWEDDIVELASTKLKVGINLLNTPLFAESAAQRAREFLAENTPAWLVSEDPRA